jgi:glutamate synthase domain-containing protein 2
METLIELPVPPTIPGSHLFFYLLGFFVAFVACIAIWDVLQKKQAIRHNFPVVGWFRYLLESQREKIQQYFIETPRAARPYNLRQREWVYRSSKALPSALGFGTDLEVDRVGAFYFCPSPFATLESEAPDQLAKPPVIGPQRHTPFEPKMFTNIADMSFGSLGRNAVQALNRGAHLSGVWLSTGEGSLSPYHTELPCDRMLEIGTGLFGVRELDGRFSMERFLKLMEQCNAVTIKLSQGAKPGSGGILPKEKITAEIAQIRNVSPDVDCYSPARFTLFDDVPGMFRWIRELQEASGKPVGIKFCLGDRNFARELVAEIEKAKPGEHPDYVLLDGSEGGTGAAPMGLADNMGTPIREALPWFDNLLREHGVRDRVRLIASGRFATAAEVAYGLALGADFINIARGFMLSMGCIQSLLCHTNRCPTGIATHSKWLQGGLDPADKGVRVANYAKALRKELMVLVRSMGLKSPTEITRHHVFVVQPDGHSKALSDLWPYPKGTDPLELRQQAGEKVVTPAAA